MGKRIFAIICLLLISIVCFNMNCIAAENETDFYEVCFVAEGGTITLDDETETDIYVRQYEPNTELGVMPFPVWTNHVFKGWYTKEGKKVSYDTVVTEGMVLYAHCKGYEFRLVFDGNEGKVSKPEKYVRTDKAFGKLPTAKRKGYIFKGWYVADECMGIKGKVTSDTIIPTSEDVRIASITLTAKWQKVKPGKVTVKKATFKNKILKAKFATAGQCNYVEVKVYGNGKCI